MKEKDIQVADVLERAATLLETVGWTKTYLKTAEGEHCAVGAIAAACGLELPLDEDFVEDSEDGPPDVYSDPCVLDAAEEVIKANPDKPWSHASTWGSRANRKSSQTLYYWNDDHAEDGDEVIEAFRKTAHALREAHGG